MDTEKTWKHSSPRKEKDDVSESSLAMFAAFMYPVSNFCVRSVGGRQVTLKCTLVVSGDFLPDTIGEPDMFTSISTADL